MMQCRGMEARRTAATRRGSALVAVSILVVSLAVLSMGVLTKSMASIGEQRTIREELAARYVAEAALGDAVYELARGASGALGTQAAPVDYGNASYWVTSIQNGNITSLVATGVSGLGGARIELVVRPSTGTLFSHAAFGGDSLDLDSNARIDSYDSSLGDYDSQAVNGSGSTLHANTAGNVGSNGNVTLSAQAAVYGNVIPGPGGTTVINGSNTYVAGTTTSAPDPVVLPPIEVPPIPSTGPLDVPNATVQTLPLGDHHFDHLVLGQGGTLTIEGPARVVFDDLTLGKNSQLLVDGSGGPVEIYVLNDFLIGSNTLIAPLSQSPQELAFFLTSDNIADPGEIVDLDEVNITSNSDFYGTLYAPYAEIHINSNFELFGSIIAFRLTIDSNALIHFDEALLTATLESSVGFETLCWRELTFSTRNP